MMNCRTCQESFDPKHPKHRGGHYGICGGCESKHKVEVNRTVGFWDVSGKSDYRMEIITNPTDSEMAMVERLGKCGPGHCHTSLGLQSNGANTSKDKMDSVHSKLYEEVHP